MISQNTFANNKKFNPLNTTCVITGGSSGIGLSIIKELKFRKAKNIINIDINKSNHDTVDFFKCDVGCNESIKLAFKEIYRKYKNIDLICSNAGIATDDDGLASAEHWNNIWKTNVLQHANVVRNSISKMLSKKNGWFLITSSAAGL